MHHAKLNYFLTWSGYNFNIANSNGNTPRTYQWPGILWSARRNYRRRQAFPLGSFEASPWLLFVTILKVIVVIVAGPGGEVHV